MWLLEVVGKYPFKSYLTILKCVNSPDNVIIIMKGLRWNTLDHTSACSRATLGQTITATIIY